MKQTTGKQGKERIWNEVSTTTIALSIETRDHLKELGKKGETYDTIIKRLMALSAGKSK